jgi:hypothetical protein
VPKPHGFDSNLRVISVELLTYIVFSIAHKSNVISTSSMGAHSQSLVVCDARACSSVLGPSSSNFSRTMTPMYRRREETNAPERDNAHGTGALASIGGVRRSVSQAHRTKQLSYSHSIIIKIDSTYTTPRILAAYHNFQQSLDSGSYLLTLAVSHSGQLIATLFLLVK